MSDDTRISGAGEVAVVFVNSEFETLAVYLKINISSIKISLQGE